MGASLAEKGIAILAVITAITVLLSYLMYRRMQHAEARLRTAQSAAEEAARAAALAAPGGIDPEIVLAILSQGLPPTLDNVYALTRDRHSQRNGSAPVGLRQPARS